MADRKIKLSIDIVSGGGGTQKIKGTFREIDEEVRRINKQTAAGAKQTQKVIEEATKSRIKVEIAEEKRAEREKKKIANDFISSIKKVESESKASATRMHSHFKSAFAGGFLGGFVGAVSTQLAKLPSMLTSTLDEMVSIAAERQNAFKGLESIATFKGVDTTAAKTSVQNLRLVKAGVIEVGDAVTGLKNLLATGFSLPQAITLMERFSDSSAFGKQAALSYGEAIRSATEGIKNQNSILVDNAGVTKNISVILKERGFEMQDLSDKTKSQNALEALYAGLLTETAAQVGDADKLTQGYTGTIAALETAKKNLYGTIGNLIIQSPEYLALIKTITAEITGNTTALQDNDSQTQTTFKSWIAWSSKAVISTVNFFDIAASEVKNFASFIAALVNVTIAHTSFALSIIPNLVNKAFIEPVNLILAKAKEHPWLTTIFGGAFGGAVAGAQIPLLPTTNNFTSMTLRAAELNFKDSRDNSANNRAAQRWERYNQFLSQPVVNTPMSDRNLNAGGPLADVGGKGKRGSGGRSTADEMRQFFQDAGFTVTRTTGSAINKGSLHPLGLAADVSVKGKTQQEITNLVAMAIEHGYRLFDERIPRDGVKQTGPHLHFEKNQRKASGFLGQDFYNAPLGYLQELDQKRLGKGTVTGDAISGFLAKQSDAVTKDERDKRTRAIADLWKKLGWIPDGKLLDEITKLAVEDARKAGGMQPNEGDVFNQFRSSALGRAGIVETSTANIPSLGLRSRLDDQISAYKEQFDITKRLEQLAFERNNHETVIVTLLEDQIVSRNELEQQLKNELEVLQKSNKAEDARVRALGERVGLSREIRDLEIELMNQGQNDSLKIQAQLYRDILEIRGRELDAVMRINRAQLELQGAMTVSNNQIRAGIYEHIAQQKTLNQAVADGINQTYDAILGRINEPLDKLNQKTKGYLSFITEPLKAMNANRLGKVFTGLVDKIFPGMGSEMEKAKNPVVGELKDHTKLLQQIVKNTGGGGSIPGKGGKGDIWDTILGPGWNADPNAGKGVPLGSGGGETSGDGTYTPGDKDGIFSNFKGMFGAKRNVLTGKDSKAAGVMSGIGSIASMVGAFIPGRTGRTLQYAGMGAQFGSMFGPWGAAVGAGVGALLGLFGGRDNAEKRLREAAASEFGISVRDKSVLSQLKSVGEGMFGRGKVGANAIAVVRSEEGQNILRAYAENSGQSGLKIDRLNMGDPNWKGNDFRSGFGGFRARGGPVRPGLTYVVGENRPELFTPNVAGMISPSVPTAVSGSNGIDTKTIQALMKTLDDVAAAVSNLQAVPPGHIVTQGLRENPAAAADAVEYEFDNDGRRATRMFKLTGL